MKQLPEDTPNSTIRLLLELFPFNRKAFRSDGSGNYHVHDDLYPQLEEKNLIPKTPVYTPPQQKEEARYRPPRSNEGIGFELKAFLCVVLFGIVCKVANINPLGWLDNTSETNEVSAHRPEIQNYQLFITGAQSNVVKGRTIIVSEKYNRKSGTVEVNVNGTSLGSCPADCAPTNQSTTAQAIDNGDNTVKLFFTLATAGCYGCTANLDKNTGQVIDNDNQIHFTRQ